MWTIKFYERESGEIPVKAFIDSLDIKLQAKVLRDMGILEQYGTAVREPYSKHIQDGVFELRTKLATHLTRIFYFFFDGSIIILTNGFVKKTQKTPKAEIEKALKYKIDYEKRNKRK